MRWFKHMTAAKDDEKIVELLAIGGLEAYGFYWAVIELVARQMEKESGKCSVTYPLPYLSRQLYCHHNKVTNLLGKLQVTGLIDVDKIEVDGRVNFKLTCPNLLKYRDEYTTKKTKNRDNIETISRQTQEQETDTETDTDIETDIKQKQKKIKEKKADVVFEIPDKLNTPDFLRAWEEWQTYRKQRRQTLTAFSIKKQIEFLVSIGAKDAVISINESIKNGYTGLFPVKQAARNNNDNGFDAIEWLKNA